MRIASILLIIVLFMSFSACSTNNRTDLSVALSTTDNLVTKAPESTYSPEAEPLPTETSEKIPIDISENITWAYKAEKVNLDWNFVDGLTYLKKGTVSLSSEQYNSLLDCLVAGPVYKWEDSDSCLSLDIGLSVDFDNQHLIIRPMINGTVFINIDGNLYISKSETFCSKLFSYTTIMPYPDLNPDDVVSMDIEYIGDNGETVKRETSSHEEIEKIVNALHSEDAVQSSSHDVFNPSAQITLHTDDQDVTVLFIASSEYEIEPEFVVNEFYWFISQDAIDTLKKCLSAE